VPVKFGTGSLSMEVRIDCLDKGMLFMKVRI